MFKNVYKYDEWKRSEHMAVRETAGWYLWTHELVEVVGPDAAAFLDYLFTGNIAGLKPSRARYTTMLNEKGQIIDDVVIWCMEENKYWVSTLYAKRMIPWFTQHKGDKDVQFANITTAWDMYAVQGPKSKEVMNELMETSVDDQKFFQILDNRLGDVDVKVNRGGFTGEKLGYEIYVAPEHTKVVVEKLRALEEKYGMKQVTEIQVMIWTLPVEKGFCTMCDLHWYYPLEVGLDWGIKWDKEFIGKEALLKVKEEGPKRTLMGFTVEDEEIHIHGKHLGAAGCPVMLEGEEIGRVTKVTYSYVLDKNIGYAIVDNSKVKVGDKVILNKHEAVLCDKIFF